MAHKTILQLTWLDFVEDCFSADPQTKMLRLGLHLETQQMLKVLIRMASRSAVEMQEVKKEISNFLTAKKQDAEHIRSEVQRFTEIWLWASPIIHDQADENLEEACKLLKQLRGVLLDIKADVPESKIFLNHLAHIETLVQKTLSEIRSAREFYGMQLLAAESALEVDPSSGREVHVIE